ncbi:glycerophosphodiester phosphodiesterase [Agromyces aerolatus]|uniref:glycerophosphodiester phosphodiesterase n=1 Tax=Agromyces sp. LY-1074 TaxID=3074080 RepID=UPI00285B1203|nr:MULTISPECIES: glycerophosphodiester phosphodiesterase family protein [unclassified Agromyces]MDR5701350.1 glycerophosphodiester phosphodiesterase family protein [Agromyces sp. LY-1074]MDR5707608.1 glycerophosphodiester phosphodiesterase family protein [Agromyces sp. LY-1358]
MSRHRASVILRRAALVAGAAVLTGALIAAQVPPRVHAGDLFGAMRAPGEAAFTVGHRGDRASAPENTMRSLELAMDELAYVETDVRLTRDGVPVLFHDVTLERIAGVGGRIEDLTLDEARRLDVGAWYADEFAGATVPTLDEFLTALAERPEARALVELKAGWSIAGVRTVAGLIDRHNLRTRVVLQSFSIETLLAIRSASPSTPRIMLTRELPADPRALADQLGVIGFGAPIGAVRREPEAVARAHDAGLAVLCYTLNSDTDWAEVRRLGVDGIITDQPSDLDAWLAVTAPGT